MNFQACNFIVYLRSLFCFVFLCQTAYAQNQDSSFNQISRELQISENGPKVSELFLSLDKKIYTPEERIWFSIFVLNRDALPNFQTLHVLLVNDMTRTLVKSQRFVIENGFSNGSFTVPGNIQSGPYSIIAYTNQFTKNPRERFFRSAITIAGPPLPFSLNFSGTLKNDSVFFEGRLAPELVKEQNGLKLVSTIYSKDRPYLDVRRKIDRTGTFNFAVNKTLLLNDPEILGSLIDKSPRMSFKYPLRFISDIFLLNIYPQGGALVEGRLSKIAFKLRNTLGKGISEHCELLEEGRKISSFISNAYGIGQFSFIPKRGVSYQVKIENNPAVLLQEFPPVVESKWFLKVPTVVSKEINLELYAPSSGAECTLVMENSQELLYASKIRLPFGSGRLKIPINGWRAGLTRIRIYDSLNKQVLLRNVFNKDSVDVKVIAFSDSSFYHKRSRVKVSLKLVDNDGKPVNGFFSLSAHTNISSQPFKDILRFSLYDRYLSTEETLPPSSYLNSDQNIEKTLFILDNSIRNGYSTNTINFFPEQEHRDGYVLFEEKPLKKSKQLLLLGKSATLLMTNSQGFFNLPEELLRGDSGSQFMISVAGKDPIGHRIVLESSYKKTDDSLAARYFASEHFDQDELSIQEKDRLRSPSINILNEVTIKGDRGGAQQFNGKIDSSGRCYDYVCYLGFLNCKTHGRGTPGQKEAIDGTKYLIDGLLGTEEVTYRCQFKGMQPYIKAIDAIALPQAYPAFDVNIENTSEKLFSSTLYHQHHVLNGENGEAEIYFYTNDRRGDFVVDIQGLTNKGAFVKQLKFRVLN